MVNLQKCCCYWDSKWLEKMRWFFSHFAHVSMPRQSCFYCWLWLLFYLSDPNCSSQQLLKSKRNSNKVSGQPHTCPLTEIKSSKTRLKGMYSHFPTKEKHSSYIFGPSWVKDLNLSFWHLFYHINTLCHGFYKQNVKTARKFAVTARDQRPTMIH